MFAKLKKILTFYYMKAVRDKGTPEYIARGWAIGMFVGFCNSVRTSACNLHSPVLPDERLETGVDSGDIHHKPLYHFHHLSISMLARQQGNLRQPFSQ